MDKYNLTNAKDIIEQIEQASEIQLNEFIDAVTRRYNALHTDREIAFFSLPTDPNIRNEELEKIIGFIRSCYNQPDSQ